MLADLLQYDNISHSVSVNARLRWYIQSNRAMYVTEPRLTLNPDLLQGQQIITGNSVVVKLAWGSF